MTAESFIVHFHEALSENSIGHFISNAHASASQFRRVMTLGHFIIVLWA